MLQQPSTAKTENRGKTGQQRGLAMTPEIKSAVKGAVQAICAGLVATLLGGSAQAQSAYACGALETNATLPAVEGDAGTFFTIRPELLSHHGLDDASVAQLSELTQTLAEQGTTLVLMPVPTRAQVLSHQLPPMASYLGYDAGAATAVHLDMVARLKAAGVNVADARADLRRASMEGTPSFFGTDRRPTSAGAEILGQSVGDVLDGHSDLDDVVRTSFETVAGDVIPLASAMHAQLQSACQSELPALRVQTHTTTRSGDASTARAVVVGTDITATASLNLTGFISQATGLNSAGYGVPGGGAFAAISSYLTSIDFQAAPPRVLVWEWPVDAPFANKGDQPMRELIAAASRTCSAGLPLADARADLTGLPVSPDTTLALDTDGVALPFVHFHFTDTNGLVRTRSIHRHPDQLLTGRFYLPLSGLDTHALVSVRIEAPSALGAQPRLNACL